MTNPMTPTPSTGDGLIERHEGFTPGPWTEFRSTDPKRGWFIDTSLGSESGNGYVIADNIVGRDAVSNARLIAAAPALLDLARKQADTIQTLQTERDAALEAVKEIRQWAESYPVKVFPEPNLEAVKDVLGKASMLYEMDRMYASWARQLLAGVGALAALTSNPNTSGEAK